MGALSACLIVSDCPEVEVPMVGASVEDLIEGITCLNYCPRLSSVTLGAMFAEPDQVVAAFPFDQ